MPWHIGIVLALIVVLLKLTEDVQFKTCHGSIGLSSKSRCKSEAFALKFAQNVQKYVEAGILPNTPAKERPTAIKLIVQGIDDCLAIGILNPSLSMTVEQALEDTKKPTSAAASAEYDEIFDTIQKCSIEAGSTSFIVHLTLVDDRKFTLGQNGGWIQN